MSQFNQAACRDYRRHIATASALEFEGGFQERILPADALKDRPWLVVDGFRAPTCAFQEAAPCPEAPAAAFRQRLPRWDAHGTDHEVIGGADGGGAAEPGGGGERRRRLVSGHNRRRSAAHLLAPAGARLARSSSAPRRAGARHPAVRWNSSLLRRNRSRRRRHRSACSAGAARLQPREAKPRPAAPQPKHRCAVGPTVAAPPAPGSGPGRRSRELRAGRPAPADRRGEGALPQSDRRRKGAPPGQQRGRTGRRAGRGGPAHGADLPHGRPKRRPTTRPSPRPTGR